MRGHTPVLHSGKPGALPGGGEGWVPSQAGLCCGCTSLASRLKSEQPALSRGCCGYWPGRAWVPRPTGLVLPACPWASNSLPALFSSSVMGVRTVATFQQGWPHRCEAAVVPQASGLGMGSTRTLSSAPQTLHPFHPSQSPHVSASHSSPPSAPPPALPAVITALLFWVQFPISDFSQPESQGFCFLRYCVVC